MRIRVRTVLAGSIVLITALVACADVNTGTGTGGGGTGTSGDASAVVTTTADGATVAATTASVTGINCAVDTATNVTLCTSTTACPSVVVDQEALPGCGFRVLNGIAALVCDCTGLLCPIGTPTSCGEAQQILSNQTQGVICQGVSDGRCLDPAATSPSASSTSTSSSGGGCDKTCASNCAGNDVCVMQCGC